MTKDQQIAALSDENNAAFAKLTRIYKKAKALREKAEGTHKHGYQEILDLIKED